MNIKINDDRWVIFMGLWLQSCKLFLSFGYEVKMVIKIKGRI